MSELLKWELKFAGRYTNTGITVCVLLPLDSLIVCYFIAILAFLVVDQVIKLNY